MLCRDSGQFAGATCRHGEIERNVGQSNQDAGIRAE